MSSIVIRTAKANETDNNSLKFYLDVKQGGADLISAFNSSPLTPEGFLKKNDNQDITKQLSLTMYNLDNTTDNNITIVITVFNVENPGGATYQMFFGVTAGKSQTLTFTMPNTSGHYGTSIAVYNYRMSSTSAGVSYVPSGSVLNGVATKVLSKKVSDSSYVGTETPNTSDNPNYQTGAPVGGITPNAPVTSKLTESSLRVSWTNTIGATKWRFKYSSVALGIIMYSPELTTGTYYDFTEYLLPHPLGDDDAVLAGTYAFRVEVQIAGDSTWYASDLGNGVYISGTLGVFPNVPPYATLKTQSSIDFDCRASSFDQILRIFSVYKDGSLFKKTRKDGQGVWKDVDVVTGDITTTTSTWFTANGNTFTVANLSAGVYKCIFKYDSFYDTPYSNEVTLGGKSTTPTIAIDGTNTSQINVTGLVSSGSKTVKLYRGGADHASTVVPDGSTSTNFVVSFYGVYTVAVIEDTKAISDLSNAVTVVTKSTTPQSISFTRVLESYKNTINSEVIINGQASDDCVEVKIYKKSDNSLVGTVTTFTTVKGIRKFSYVGNNNMNVGDTFYIKQRETVSGIALLESDASPDNLISEFNPTCLISNLAINKGTVGENDYVITFVTGNAISVSYKITNNPTFGLGDVYQEGALSLDVNPSVTNGKKAYINLSTVPEGSYYCHVYSTTSGSTCSGSSSQFTFDISTSDVVEVEIGSSFGQDCLSLAIGTVTEVRNNDGSVTFTAQVTTSTPLDVDTLFYGKLTKDAETYGQTVTTGVVLSGGAITINVPSNKVPPRNTSLDLVVTVNTSSSAQYGCSATKTIVTTSESSLTESPIPVIRDLQENGGKVFVECCVNAKVVVYVNNSTVYATLNNTTLSVVEVVSDYVLKIGDVLNAVQTCPNQTVSKLSASRTVTSTCDGVSSGNIEGSTLLPIGAISTYTVSGLTGEQPYTYIAEVSGGTIQSGQGTPSVSVKWKSTAGKGIIGFTVGNCDGRNQVVITKEVTLSTNQVPTGGIRPRITSVINGVVKGLGDVGMIITLYDSNNKVVKTGIVVDNSGTWNSGRVVSANAYYAIGILSGVKTEISNIAINLDACRNHKGSVLC